MKTILAARDSIAQLWGCPRSKDTTYRLMKYLLRVEVEDGILLHNNVTGHLVLLSNEEAEVLPNLPAKPSESMKELIANHFLVPEDFDEYRSVKQLRAICRKRSTGDAINHYIILPTTFCNAHCFYCYESDYPRIHMTEETANKVVEFIDEHHKDKDVELSWFGGEPLVGIERIDQISQGLRDREIPFTSTMISNAYLFDEKVVKRSIDLWKLQRVQVTLDGTEEVYNRVKAYAGVKDNPFERVLKNIELLSKNNIFVNIRLNVDFYNKDNIRVLIEKLGRKYAENPNVMVYLNMLFSDQGYEPVRHSDDEKIELLEIIEEYMDLLKDLKVNREGKKIPSLQYKQCMADDAHAIEIQPDGSFCRCEHENALDSYGNLEVGIFDSQKLQKWREMVERSDYCPECCIYPACYMLRYCMSGNDPCTESIRIRGWSKYREVLRSVYQKSLEDEKDESV